jgi:hypothetical protein
MNDTLWTWSKDDLIAEVRRLRNLLGDDPPPAPLVVDPKLITYLIGSGTKVPPKLPPPEHIDGHGGGQ